METYPLEVFKFIVYRSKILRNPKSVPRNEFSKTCGFPNANIRPYNFFFRYSVSYFLFNRNISQVVVKLTELAGIYDNVIYEAPKNVVSVLCTVIS